MNDEEVSSSMMSLFDPLTNGSYPMMYEYGKFGRGITGQRINSSGSVSLYAPNIKYQNTNQITIEFWAKCPPGSSRSNSSVRIGADVSSTGTIAQLGLNINYHGGILILNYIRSDWQSVSILYNTPLDKYWHHYALVSNHNSCFVFIDGKKVATTTRSISSSAPGDYVSILCDQGDYIDEVRISDIVRYESDFTPPDRPFP